MFLLARSLGYHKKVDLTDYRATITGDAAGYYQFLPNTFYIQFNPDKITQIELDKKRRSYKINDGKIISKYPYGVALMQSPFFGAAHIYASVTHQETSGYSTPYYRMINWAAAIYGVLGLIFLFAFLKRQFDIKPIYLILLILTVCFGTNFYFYIIMAPGYSHVYSFFLFALYLFYFQKWSFTGFSKNLKTTILLGAIAGLIMVTRSINLLFIIAFSLLYNVKNWNDFIIRIKALITPFNLICIGLPAIIFLIPQLVYNNYAFGGYFKNGYINETFDFLNPKIWKHLASPLNGAFIYTPIYVIATIGLFFLWFIKKLEWLWLLPFFLILVYINSSWHAWWFGCSLGQRVYVEYLVLLAIPLLFIYRKIGWKIAFLISSIFIVANVFISEIWTFCYFGDRDSFDTLFELISKNI